MPSAWQTVRNLGVQRLLDGGQRRESLNRQVRLRRQPLDAAQDVGDVLFLRQDLLEVLEPQLELGHLRLEFREPPGGRDTPGDVRAKRGQPRLAKVDVFRHVGHVEVPESVRRPGTHHDKGADLAPPGKFAERQFHGYPVCLSVASNSAFNESAATLRCTATLTALRPTHCPRLRAFRLFAHAQPAGSEVRVAAPLDRSAHP